MKRISAILAGVILFFGAILLASSMYIVNEDEVAVVKSLGKIVAVIVDVDDVATVKENIARDNYDIEVIPEKGLHFKVPFIESVTKYTSKFLTYTSNQELINTKDERRIEIQMYAQYKIVDPLTFNLAVGSQIEAGKRMDESIYKTVINSANTLRFDEFFYQSNLEDLLETKQEALNKQLVSDYGLYVSNIGINHKSFPSSNITNIEEKMAKEIEKDSEKLIAEGDSEFLQAQSTTDRQKVEVVSKAVEEAAIIMAEADAEAIRIYQESLQKDLAFYQFMQRMEIYKSIKDTTIFLDGDNAIFDLIDGYNN